MTDANFNLFDESSIRSKSYQKRKKNAASSTEAAVPNISNEQSTTFTTQNENALSPTSLPPLNSSLTPITKLPSFKEIINSSTLSTRNYSQEILTSNSTSPPRQNLVISTEPVPSLSPEKSSQDKNISETLQASASIKRGIRRSKRTIPTDTVKLGRTKVGDLFETEESLAETKTITSTTTAIHEVTPSPSTKISTTSIKAPISQQKEEEMEEEIPNQEEVEQTDQMNTFKMEQEQLLEKKNNTLLRTRRQEISYENRMLALNSILSENDWLDIFKGSVLDNTIFEMKKRIARQKQLSLFFERKEEIEKSQLSVSHTKTMEQYVEFLQQESAKRFAQIQVNEEQIYIDQKSSKTVHSNENSLQQFFLRNPKFAFDLFDQNGNVVHDPPLYLNKNATVMTKPAIDFEEEQTEIELLRTQPKSFHLNHPHDSHNANIVQITISSVQFVKHPLMTEEQSLCIELLHMVKEYQNLLDVNLSDYYRSKISTLRSTLSTLRSNKVAQMKQEEEEFNTIKQWNDKMASIRNDIKHFVRNYETEQSRMLSLLTSIIEKWNRIVSIRNNQQEEYPIRIVFGTKQVNENEEKSRVRDMIKQELVEWQEDLEYQSLPLTDKTEKRKEIKNRILKHEKPFGEPIITPYVIKETNHLFHKSSTAEQYYIKLYKKKQLICKSKVCTLKSDFTLAFEQSFSISFSSSTDLNTPQELSIKLVQKKLPKEKKIFQLVIPLQNQQQQQQYEFTSDLYQGTLFTKIKSKHTMNFKMMNPSARDLLSLQHLKHWLQVSDIMDPNDPFNTGIYSFLEKCKESDIVSHGFYLTEKQDLLFFQNEDPSYLRRIRLLQKREEANIAYKVPLQEEKVTIKTIKEFELLVQKQSKEQIMSDYLKQIRDNVKEYDYHQMDTLDHLPVVNFKTKQYKWNELVLEIPFPKLGGLSWIKDFFAPIRPLHPYRKERQVDMSMFYSQHSIPVNTKIVIQIIRGYSIPKRKESIQNDTFRQYRSQKLKQAERVGMKKDFMNYTKEQVLSQELEEKDNTEEETVLSFVSVTFQESQKRTKTVQGQFPQYNEMIELPFTIPNFNSTNQWELLSAMDDVIHFDLYDEFTVMNFKNDTDIYSRSERVEHRWLGSLSIPFSTLYQHQHIMGSFTFHTPPLYLAYDKQEECSISLSITLEPLLPIVEDSIQSIPYSSLEEESIIQKGLWYQNYICKYSTVSNKAQCKWSVFVPNQKDKTLLMTRYIKAQEPPMMLDSVTKCVRFVSLLPCIKDSLSRDVHYDVWIDSQEFLNTRAGDYVEHAILLCNYLKYLKKRAWVVLGYGIPEGKTAYTLVWEEEEYVLYNAVTGIKYSVLDSSCPLLQVHMLFDEHNIFTNIQKEMEPWKIVWKCDNNLQCWIPFVKPSFSFKKWFLRREWEEQVSVGLESIQETRLQYVEISKEEVERLEQTITSKIRSAFFEWRRLPCQLNAHVSSILKEILIEYEIAKQNNQIVTQEIHDKYLNEVSATFSLQGIPLHFSFTEMKVILDQIKNTLMHRIEEPDVEFSIAVYVCPYVNQIFSVWVYMAAILKKY